MILKIESAIRTMLFNANNKESALLKIKTYNKIKLVLLNCSNQEKQLNLFIFNGLLKEIKVNI